MVRRKFSVNRFPSIKVNNKQIKFVNSVKYLNIIIDCNLNFVKHAEYISSRIKTVFAKLVRVTRSDWGLKEKTVHLLYSSVFISIVTYGASMVKRKLDSAQRFMLLACSRVCKIVSNEALHAENCLPIYW